MSHARAAQDRPTVLYFDNSDDKHLLMRAAFLRASTGLHLQCLTDIASTKEYLTGSGHHRDRVTHRPPVLVLADSNLDGEVGTDLIRWVRQQRQFDDLPLILMTGNHSDHRIQHAYACGANHCLRKCDSLASLVTFVHCLAGCIASNPACFESLKQLPEYAAQLPPSRSARRTGAPDEHMADGVAVEVTPRRTFRR